MSFSTRPNRLGIADWLYQKYEKDILHIPVELLKKLRGAADIDAALLNSLELKAYGDSLKEKLQNMTEEEKQEIYGSLLDRMIQCSIEHKTNTTKNQRIKTEGIIMNEKVTCSLCTVYEHDMDVMLMQAMLTDLELLEIFINKTDWAGLDLTPVHAEISNSDTDLGETDITVILSDGVSKFAMLIEDKIDAVAQPDQHDRYVKRGDKAVKEKLYSDYKVFIVCPQKYYDTDDEAKKYEHFVSYEECAEHFSKSTDSMALIRYQEVMQAISKAKKPTQVTLNEDANSFFRKYREYQRENFPQLEMRTKETSNGYWVDYKCGFPYQQAYLLHKMADGEVDVTFSGSKDKAPILESICKWLNSNGFTEVSAPITGKSVALRMNVPKLQYRDGWENISQADLDKCFTAITKMVELAKMLDDVQRFLSTEGKE